MSPLRIWLVGFGTVGRRLAGVLDAQAGRLAAAAIFRAGGPAESAGEQ